MSRGARTYEQTLTSFRWRSLLVLGVFACVALGLGARAAHMQVLNADFYTDKADRKHLRVETITAHRGAITDRNGEPLAISTPMETIWADPQQLASAMDALGALPRLLDRKKSDLESQMARNADKRFVYLKRQVEPELAEQVMELGIPGIGLRREYRRFYPVSEITGHLIGYTNIEDQGQEGLEHRADSWLSGEAGQKRVLRDRKGRTIETVESIRPAKHGRDLRTSIDLRIQYIAHRALNDAVKRSGAKSGSIVVMDVQTGEILAVTNQPDYNPNRRADRRGALVRNRAVLDIFQPGSSIKPFIIAAALESERFRPGSVIDTSPGRMYVSGEPISDKNNLGAVSLTTVLARSSNVGMAKAALELDKEQIWSVLSRFGFGDLTGVLVPKEERGMLRDHSEWYELDHASVSFGYTISVTALQLAQAYAALGNGGVKLMPSIEALDERPSGTRVISERVADDLMDMMEAVVIDGTGKRAAIFGYRVAGKTGTAEIYKQELQRHSSDHHVVSFAGLAPASDPRLVAVVVINEPQGEERTGGAVAAPVFAEVMGEALRLMAVPPDARPTMVAGSRTDGQQ